MHMPGMAHNKMRRRPILSMMHNATRVKTKLVAATMMETAVAFLKPMVSKIVAEKYINELKPVNCWMPCKPQAKINALKFAACVWQSLMDFQICCNGVPGTVEFDNIISWTSASACSSEMFSTRKRTLLALL